MQNEFKILTKFFIARFFFSAKTEMSDLNVIFLTRNFFNEFKLFIDNEPGNIVDKENE